LTGRSFEDASKLQFTENKITLFRYGSKKRLRQKKIQKQNLLDEMMKLFYLQERLKVSENTRGADTGLAIKILPELTSETIFREAGITFIIKPSLSLSQSNSITH